MAISVDGDLTGLNAYIGAVGGILQAVEDPRFEGDFVDYMMRGVESEFVTETIAVKNAGRKSLNHVFEWGDKQGEVSDTPLFKLTRSGQGGLKTMGYVFLPSQKQVPLPDPDRYGFGESRLQFLRRHTFQLKAIVMETQGSVTISPLGGKRLFIPTTQNERGFIMTERPQTINPGGPVATGGFASWWNEWFGLNAQSIVNEGAKRAENWLVATGRKYVRYAAGTVIDGVKVGGRFAKGKLSTAAYINSQEKSVKEKILRESSAQFDEEKWFSTWDD